MSVIDDGTKVFGVGLSKTGTSSLAEALNILDIKTIHSPHDEQTYDDLRWGNYRLRIMEGYQGVTDNVAPFYAQLDRSFPGSKFILTVREKQSWLRSIELHWRLMMDWWHNDPPFKQFQEFISACEYGMIGFHRDRFSHVYDLHLRNVLAHFEGRPDDLLVIDICGGEGWERLCPFLGLRPRDEPFPHANGWMHLLPEASREIAEVIPAGEMFILVDQEGFGRDFGAGRRRIPFLERNGQYFGPPPDDATAVSELERLKQNGAGYIAFGWPAFWWLDYYPALYDHLRKSYRCILENRRLIVFELRREASERPPFSTTRDLPSNIKHIA